MPVLIHGDPHIKHLFVDGDEVTGIIDRSEASRGDALFDLDLICAWWSLRCLVVVRWLFDNGYGAPERFPEIAVLQSQD